MTGTKRLIHVQAACVLTLAAVAALPAQTFTTLANFDGTTGAGGTAKLAQGTDGNFYGVKAGGGAGNGTIFKVTRSGALTAFYDFQFTDGAVPLSDLAQDPSGNFYGTTYEGGNSTGCFNFGCGTIFKITPGGMLTSLYDFNPTGGFMPVGGLVQAADGNFYGTTTTGGTHTCAVPAA